MFDFGFCLLLAKQRFYITHRHYSVVTTLLLTVKTEKKHLFVLIPEETSRC